MKVESSRGTKTSVFQAKRRQAAGGQSTSIHRENHHHPEIRAGRGPANTGEQNVLINVQLGA